MKSCLMCAGPVSNGKRSDSVFCSDTCRAKYWASKKKGELNGLGPKKKEPEYKPEDVPEEKKDDKTIPDVTVDMDLEPLINLVPELNSDETGSNKENPVSESNKAEPEKENESEEEMILPPEFITKTTQVTNLAYHFYDWELKQCREEIKECRDQIAHFTNRIREEESKNGLGHILTGTGIGLGAPLLYNHFQSAGSGSIYPDQILDKNGKPLVNLRSQKKLPAKTKKPSPPEKKEVGFWGVFLLAALGTGIGAISRVVTKDSREAEKAKKIGEYRKLISGFEAELQKRLIVEVDLALELAKRPGFFTVEREVPNPAYTEMKNKIEREKQKRAQEQAKKKASDNEENPGKDLSGMNGSDNQTGSNDVNNLNNETMKKKKKNLETDKILSMKKIAGLKQQLLNFNGKWKDFFGLPQTNFFCIIHGMSGEGKSHFAMQFGKYLAERFGNVLYISGEEGFATTFQQKIKTLGAIPGRYYGSEIKTGEGLLQDVPNQYHFIIIDSLNNMGIDAELMRAIRNKYKKSAIIAICQSTKDGKMRGSYELIHDSDMAVKVVEGIATTTKNRFKEKHKNYDVFAVYRKKTDHDLNNNKKKDDDLEDDPDNIIK